MSGRTGLGPLELAVLGALDGLGAHQGGTSTKNDKVLGAIEQAGGFGRRYSYQVLCDLARPWRAPISLVEFHGDFGSLFPAAAPSYGESRLTSVGAVALMSERGETTPLPLSLINGTLYQGGLRPPFAPSRVIDALLALLSAAEISDDALVGLVGPPAFPHGCDIVGDLAELVAGRPTDLRLYPAATMTVSAGRPVIELSRFPPELWAMKVVDELTEHLPGVDADDRNDDFERLPILSVDDISFGASDHSNERVRVVLENGADPEAVLTLLKSDPYNDPFSYWARSPIRSDVTVEIGRPLSSVLRDWVDRHRQPGLAEALVAFKETIDTQTSAQRAAQSVPLRIMALGQTVGDLVPPARRRTFPEDLARRPLPRSLELQAPVALTYRKHSQLSGAASGSPIVCVIRHGQPGRARGAIGYQPFRVEWQPKLDAAPGHYHLTLTGTLTGEPIQISADLQPLPGALFDHADLTGTIAGQPLTVTVEAADGAFGSSDTVAIDGSLHNTAIAIYAAISSDLRSAVMRGSIDNQPVHLDASKTYRTGDIAITGSFPGPNSILLLCTATLLSFM